MRVRGLVSDASCGTCTTRVRCFFERVTLFRFVLDGMEYERDGERMRPGGFGRRFDVGSCRKMKVKGGV